MRVKSIRSIGRRKVYDISVQDAEHYVLENGVVTHNTGSYYAADNIFIVGRQQDKKGQGESAELLGYNFIINVEKSRYVKEKSRIPVTVNFDSGINRYSGLLDMALESGHVVSPTNGWYQRVNVSTGEVIGKKFNKADANSPEFMDPIVFDEAFKTWVRDTYSVGGGKSIYSEDKPPVVEDE
jgi:hypothetical protein